MYIVHEGCVITSKAGAHRLNNASTHKYTKAPAKKSKKYFRIIISIIIIVL